ncbi:hypothetical protein PGT21_026616 [Puccinia graminis f. sp. tritici]|uniref:Uncharacterized protein n=1 Tax=Puccinia graminis f. sp. tritici TaxID=56615 RepID=A0A5B0QJF7_PUCGR|nr:hypothetical protein PGT21_026616 [Puccinia graminis f. sp. tritici]
MDDKNPGACGQGLSDNHRQRVSCPCMNNRTRPNIRTIIGSDRFYGDLHSPQNEC